MRNFCRPKAVCPVHTDNDTDIDRDVRSSVLRQSVAAMLAVLLLACANNNADNDRESDDPKSPSTSDYAVSLPDSGTYRSLQGTDGGLKFFTPTDAETRPPEMSEPGYFQDSEKFRLHHEFLREFPSQIDISVNQHNALVLATDRALFAGELAANATTRHPDTDNTGIPAFSLTTDEQDLHKQPDAANLQRLYTTLRSCIPKLPEFWSMWQLRMVRSGHWTRSRQSWIRSTYPISNCRTSIIA